MLDREEGDYTTRSRKQVILRDRTGELPKRGRLQLSLKPVELFPSLAVFYERIDRVPEHLCPLRNRAEVIGIRWGQADLMCSFTGVNCSPRLSHNSIRAASVGFEK